MEQHDEETHFASLDLYPWHADKEFKVGLSAILGSATSAAQIEALTIRARCFYYTRKFSIPVDYEAYKAHILSEPELLATLREPLEQKLSRPGSVSHAEQSISKTLDPDAKPFQPSQPAHTAQDVNQQQSPITKGNPEYPKPFAEIIAMITSGQPIPGIRDIPSTVLSDQITQPVASKRRKPWETDVHEIGGGGPGQGTFGDHRDEPAITQELPENVA